MSELAGYPLRQMWEGGKLGGVYLTPGVMRPQARPKVRGQIRPFPVSVARI